MKPKDTILTLIFFLVSASANAAGLTPALHNYCAQLEDKFKLYNWGKPLCENYEWNHVRNSAKKTPLIWTIFGNEKSQAAKENTTLILCGVHGDEITPVKFCFDLLEELKKPEYKFDDKLIVIAPLVTPDSFLITRPSRTNSAGVDVNRNFPTKDWHADAHRLWKKSYRRDKRKNPGPRAASEQETIFQMNLILRYKPHKVITVHAPLTMIDYDGPTLVAEKNETAKDVLLKMSEKAENYKVANYPVFPGSLGNWAGREQNIPTYTIELPNSNPADSAKFWSLFKDAVLYGIDRNMKKEELITDQAPLKPKKE
ncbi:MAG: M14 family zinc carboxypeptidase [Bacteriovoracaceae bacterium]